MRATEKVVPYTEPDLEQIRKEAYDKGYDDAVEEIGSDEQAIADKAYKNGLSDAWEAVRKISSMDSATRSEVFGLVITSNIVDENTAAEVIEKLKAHEQEQDEKKKTNYYFEMMKDAIETSAKEYGMSLDEVAAVLESLRRQAAPAGKGGCASP